MPSNLYLKRDIPQEAHDIMGASPGFSPEVGDRLPTRPDRAVETLEDRVLRPWHFDWRTTSRGRAPTEWCFVKRPD
jgi:hypothetical protein